MEQRPDKNIAVDIAAVSCDCSAEAVALLNSLINVKAEVLSLKQSHAAVELVRSVRNTVFTINCT